MAVPVVYKDATLAVLVFLSVKPRQFDKGMIEDFNSICSRLVFASMDNVKPLELVTSPVNQAQIADVQKLIGKEGVFSETLIYQELDWYYNRLGLQQSYFGHFSPHQIAKHVHAFIASKKVAQITNHIESLQFDFETPEGWFHLCPMLGVCLFKFSSNAFYSLSHAYLQNIHTHVDAHMPKTVRDTQHDTHTHIPHDANAS